MSVRAKTEKYYSSEQSHCNLVGIYVNPIDRICSAPQNLWNWHAWRVTNWIIIILL